MPSRISTLGSTAWRGHRSPPNGCRSRSIMIQRWRAQWRSWSIKGRPARALSGASLTGLGRLEIRLRVPRLVRWILPRAAAASTVAPCSAHVHASFRSQTVPLVAVRATRTTLRTCSAMFRPCSVPRSSPIRAHVRFRQALRERLRCSHPARLRYAEFIEHQANGVGRYG
jgi:hypothetical protein